MKRLAAHARHLSIMLLLAVGVMPTAISQTSQEDVLKSAFILNFMRYTVWPESSLAAPQLQICALSSNSLNGKLKELVKQEVHAHKLSVLEGVTQTNLSQCHVLYVSGAHASQIKEWLPQLSTLPILTITDTPLLEQEPLMINLQQRTGRMRFSVKLNVVRTAGLELRSQLLDLASEVQQ
jgi:hypothetical protein